MNNTIHIALADDHTILRKGVAEILSRFGDIKVVIEAGNGQELLDKISAAKTLPDVCIVDINMPVMNGYETTAAICRQWPDIKVLALSMYDAELNVIRMLRNGAHGYVLKDADPMELRVAITEVAKHGIYHSDLVRGRTKHSAGNFSGTDLNDRETQFLELCCTELTYKEIAEKMHLSPRTIDGYREALFERLTITSRTGLVIFAIKTGLVHIK